MQVKSNGTFPLAQGAGWAASTLYTSALGGASVKLQVRGVDLVDGVLEDTTQYIITHGRGAQVEVVVTGFTTEFTIETYEV